MTSGQPIAGRWLDVPRAEREVFDQNFISASIAEFRYPTLILLDDAVASTFARKVRKRFPKLSKSFSASLAETGLSPGKSSFKLESRHVADGTITLQDSTMNLTVSNYISYESFRKLALEALNALDEILDTDFYTRVGYRVVNTVPIPRDTALSEYINSSLVSPLQFEVLGTLSSSRFEMHGFLDESRRYTFRYGSADDQSPTYDQHGNLRFMLDYDYYSEDIDATERMALLDGFHERHYDFFWWALADRSKTMLRGS